jgi:predicted metal-dependent peptidase
MVAVKQMTPYEKLAKARKMARDRFPFFSYVLYSLKPYETESVPTLAVSSGGIMAWNPRFVEKCTLAELMWVITHEAMHILNKHHRRWVDKIGLSGMEMQAAYEEVSKNARLKATSKNWNIAADAAVNQKLEELAEHVGERLPEGYVSPRRIEAEYGLTVEGYYDHLRNKEEPEEPKDPPPPGEEPPEDGEDGDCPGDEPGDGGDIGGQYWGPASDLKPGQGESGSSAGGLPQEWEKEAEDAGLEGREEDEMDEISDQVAKDIVREAQKGEGKVPGSFQVWAEGKLDPPHVHWSEKLSSAMSTSKTFVAGRSEAQWGKVSRKQWKIGGFGPNKPIMPHRVDPVPLVAVVGDTSGSMGTTEISYIIGTIKGIVDASGADVLFCACDASAGEVVRLNDWSEAESLMTGGGGTDFRPAFDALEKEFPQPTTVVYVTDGGGTAPDKEPNWCEVIWCLVGPYKETPHKPDWSPVDYGTIINIDE